jgi:putative ABC transport system permease protein
MVAILGQGAALAAVGVLLGGFGTVALARLLTSLLFGVSSLDPVSFLSAAGLLLAIGLVAALGPARRAGTVDPAKVLRDQ